MIAAAFLTSLLLVALLVWAIDQAGCKHENLRGVANYFDHELHVFVHLKECEDCGLALITHER